MKTYCILPRWFDTVEKLARVAISLLQGRELIAGVLLRMQRMDSIESFRKLILGSYYVIGTVLHSLYPKFPFDVTPLCDVVAIV